MVKAKRESNRKHKPLQRTAAKALTERSILALKPGQKRADGASVPGSGRLIVRSRSRGDGTVREFFFRYYDANRVERMMLLGVHGNMTLERAREEADRQRALVSAGSDPHIARALEQQANREADQQIKLEQRKGTLADLLDAYVKHLRDAGKSSADDTKRTLRRHVIEPFPALAAKRARDVTAEDVTDVLAKMISKGIGRRSNIVRALLRAAFAYGARLDNDQVRKAEALNSGENEPAKHFGITVNPVATTAPAKKFDRAWKRVLQDDELRDYWQALDKLHPSVGNALRVTLLLGGQRMSQLKRVTWVDYDEQDRVLRLRDAKGRGGEREHLLPVSERVAAIMKAQRAISSEGFIFSTTGGKKEIDLSTLSSTVTEIARDAWDSVARTDNETEPYSAADIRRTVETRMAALGISKDIRAQVLSHGRVSGVQGRHYDQHDYLPEKAAALAAWEAEVDRVLNNEAPKVIQGRFRRQHASA